MKSISPQTNASPATTGQTYMAIDQYGTTYHSLGPHPRKALIERIGYGRVSKMYRDTKEGAAVHVGYVVGPFWLALYAVEPTGIAA